MSTSKYRTVKHRTHATATALIGFRLRRFWRAFVVTLLYSCVCYRLETHHRGGIISPGGNVRYQCARYASVELSVNSLDILNARPAHGALAAVAHDTRRALVAHAHVLAWPEHATPLLVQANDAQLRLLVHRVLLSSSLLEALDFAQLRRRVRLRLSAHALDVRLRSLDLRCRWRAAPALAPVPLGRRLAEEPAAPAAAPAEAPAGATQQALSEAAVAPSSTRSLRGRQQEAASPKSTVFSLPNSHRMPRREMAAGWDGRPWLPHSAPACLGSTRILGASRTGRPCRS
eukprot:scaffold18928_cov69-Phaeocystis_antarctica.AAC.5